MSQVEQKFQVGDEVDYIDPSIQQWVGPAKVVEILWSNHCGFFLYIIDNPEYASACCDQELRLHGSAESSDLVGEL